MANVSVVTSAIDKSIYIITTKKRETIFFFSCPRDHKVIGRLKFVKMSHKHFFRQSPLRSKGYIEIKMFQELVLAIVLVSYHNGLYILTYFFD